MRGCRTLIAGWILVAASGATGCGRPAPPGDAAAVDEWVGNMRFGDSRYLLRLDLQQGVHGTAGILRVPTYGNGLFARTAVSRVERSHETVSFAAKTPLGLLRFAGRMAAGRLAGEVAADGRTGRFDLVRASAERSRKLDGYVGIYTVDPGLVLLVTYGGNGGLKFHLDSQPPNAGMLLPISGDTFVVPGARDPVSVANGSMTFRRDRRGRVAGLTWHSAGRPDWTATRSRGVTQRQLTFRSGAVRLAGTLLMPETPGMYPCVVSVHGSGPQARDEWLDHAARLPRAGIAMFLYDKRGAGQSSGDWERASLQDLAGDALAAVRVLRRTPGIAPGHIGLMGGSQGGWIVPIAAARSREVAFIISVSGSGVSPARQELYRQRNSWAGAGLSAEDRQVLNERWTAFYASLNKAARPAGLAPAPAVDAPARLRPYLPPQPGPMPPMYQHLGFNFDPLPEWRRVRCPALVINGGADEMVPSGESVRLIEQALVEGGNRSHTIRTFPGADHGIMVPQPDGSRGFAPGYFELLISWIKRQSAGAGGQAGRTRSATAPRSGAP